MVVLDFTTEDPYFETPVEFDGVVYTLSIGYDFRAARWFFSLFDSNGAAILRGIRLIPGEDLLGPFTDPRLPPGRLEVVTRAVDHAPPQFEELGVTASIVYLDEEDVAAYAGLLAYAGPRPVNPVAS